MDIGNQHFNVKFFDRLFSYSHVQTLFLIITDGDMLVFISKNLIIFNFAILLRYHGNVAHIFL